LQEKSKTNGNTPLSKTAAHPSTIYQQQSINPDSSNSNLQKSLINDLKTPRDENKPLKRKKTAKKRFELKKNLAKKTL
jgi:hypothetical protein